MNLPAGAQ